MPCATSSVGWVANCSDARDSEVLRRHLDGLITKEPPATIHTTLRERIDGDLHQAHDHGSRGRGRSSRE